MIRGNALGPLFALLYAASFWGVVWYPVRLLAGELLSWREWLGGTMIIGAGLVAVYYGDVDGA